MSIEIPRGGVCLFQGDSITDASRDRGDSGSLGRGYASLVAKGFAERRPGHGVTFLNRGQSGNRVADLVDRWTVDCIDLKPDVVSLLIGINDTWRRFDRGLVTSADQFEGSCRLLLDRVFRETSARVLLLEPFLLPVKPELAAWREDLDPKRAVVRRLAADYGADILLLDDLFREACREGDPSRWAGDGIHPSMEGHHLIANAILAEFTSG